MKIDNTLLDELYKECIKSRNKKNSNSKEWYYYEGMIDLLEELQSVDKDIDLSNANDSMKDYALSIIDDLEENENHDFNTHSYVYQWRYDERQDVLVTMVLGDFEIFNLQGDGDLH